MAKKVETVEDVKDDVTLDLSENDSRVPLDKITSSEINEVSEQEVYPSTKQLVNCLRPEKLVVRYIPRETGW